MSHGTARESHARMRRSIALLTVVVFIGCAVPRADDEGPAPNDGGRRADGAVAPDDDSAAPDEDTSHPLETRPTDPTIDSGIAPVIDSGSPSSDTGTPPPPPPEACGVTVGKRLCDVALVGYVRTDTSGLASSATYGPVATLADALAK